jgi:chaperonin cofactor prefoldin
MEKLEKKKEKIKNDFKELSNSIDEKMKGNIKKLIY